MSAAILARLRHITDEIQHLVSEVDRLSERVLVLEAEKDTGQPLDLATLEPVKRGPGRPRKAAQ